MKDIEKLQKNLDHVMAVIMFAVEQCDREEASFFLESWVHGDWDVIKEEWPEFRDLENHP